MQVWIGTKQKELEAGSMQLMHQYTPWATGLLAILVPIFEPVGFVDTQPRHHPGLQLHLHLVHSYSRQRGED